MKRKRLGETLPVRLPDETEKRLLLIAKITGLSKSDVMRMAINHGLPQLEAGKLAFSR
ncbi:MAG: hypothetical protein ACOVMP_03295 [Chthoniobacterales bacterium]